MPLRNFDKVWIDQSDLKLSGVVSNSLLFGCTVKDLRGVSLLNCDNNRSNFDIQSLDKLKGFACTMDCGTFRNVRLSELIFDLVLMLLHSTSGNDTKRRKILHLLGKDRVKELSNLMELVDLGS